MRLAVSAGVAWTRREGVVYVAPLPDGPIYVLDGVAALMWQEAVEQRYEDITARIAADTGTAVEEIEGETERFLSDLIARGLLTQGSD